ncbi:low temperature requirement protein A [Plantactinospora soyae]|uniref:Low temperature requirement protein LtrA n=1 Tax=Plantactinospora soyae TaxID=1544732 RepID=A0A927R211_9ACTN|nr:low temperature requirement protein A [Plantactinospora soyae]MBE1490288.1 low temperature requirement protein LtrA [Plantactinospora soyae]
MRASTKAALERDPEGSRRVSLLELFFDLVYVVALALISRYLVQNLHWAGVAQSAVLLAAVWWVWAITAFLTDLYDPQQVSIQLLTVAVMLGSLLMAATVPHAFGSGGLVLACAYVGIHLGRGLFLVPSLRGQPAQGRAIRIFFWFVVSAVPWIAGGLTSGEGLRTALWALAVLIDYLAFSLGYPTPRLGRLPQTQYNVTAAHLAERYQQFFMIALGDAILITGFAYSGVRAGPAHSGAFIIAFLSTVLMWRIYTHRAGEVLPLAIESVIETRRFFRIAPYTHLTMVTGVVLKAASFELIIARPLDHPGWAMIALVLGGPALFLIGRSRFEYEVFGRVSPSRLVALGVLGAISPAMRLLPLVAVAACAMLVLAGMAAVDTARSWGRSPERPSPPV